MAWMIMTFDEIYHAYLFAAQRQSEDERVIGVLPKGVFSMFSILDKRKIRCERSRRKDQ
jgi:hypothetical protein